VISGGTPALCLTIRYLDLSRSATNIAARETKVMTDQDDFIYVKDRALPYTVFDADNHLYETEEALTKFMPKQYDGLIKYVEVKGRTKLALRDHITNYIPNPTFSRVAVPGGYGMEATRTKESKVRGPGGSIGQKVRAMPGLDAFFDPEPRLELMRDMGIDRTLLWPTLVSAVEERLASDPDAVCAVVSAFNSWLHEHWSYNYEDAIYSTPLISLANMDKAVEELEVIAERGAKIFLIRVAPVPTWQGRMSFALPRFDPFWKRVQELGLLVGMHAGDPGYTRYTNEWEGAEFEANFASTGTPGFQLLMSEKSALVDAMASLIGHGLATRFPDLRFMPVEFASSWIRPFVRKLEGASERSSVLYDEDPLDVFKRSVWIHLFHESDPQGLLDIGLSADHLMFGSDFPHPEGMEDPLAYSEVLGGMTAENQALIMGGALADLIDTAA
jgi:predicted TIM-barrel fold metal-dependent hydrolase